MNVAGKSPARTELGVAGQIIEDFQAAMDYQRGNDWICGCGGFLTWDSWMVFCKGKFENPTKMDDDWGYLIWGND